MPKRSAQRRAEEARLADQALLASRLFAMGLRGIREVALHQNRTVMVSVSRRVLRIHRGFAYAPDRVLQAVVTFVAPHVPTAERRRAEDALLAFPVQRYAPPAPRKRRPRARRPGDRRVLSELRRLHGRFNARHFDGRLTLLPFRLSDRMTTQLGEVVLDEHSGRAVEIGVSRRHLERDGWHEVEKTLLHEMVHQWQAETGQEIDHGPAFRRKALEVGIEPAAHRDVLAPPPIDGLEATEE